VAKLTQTQIGRAFGYAVARAGQQILGEENIALGQSEQLTQAEKLFAQMDQDEQFASLTAGRAAIRKLVECEGHLEDAANGQSKVWLRFDDKKTDPFSKRHNDTRDILIGSQHSEWEIGLVAKHGHGALKHSRLSQKIDFGREWLAIPCSKKYFEEIAPIFNRLEHLRKDGAKWNSLDDKNETVYIPLLSAFRHELLTLDLENPLMVAPKLVRYLLGDYDYYRIIQYASTTTMDVFNFNGTLNSSSTREPNLRLKKLELPQKLIELEFAKHEKKPMMTSSTTLVLVCDAGWTISFRLHNPSKHVEPSLKFDIKLVKAPDTLQSFAMQQ
jgi:hypothetical protein